MDVGTPVAEPISEPNHFLCCGSAINLAPRDSILPGNGHADRIWSCLARFENRLFLCIRVFADPIRRGKALLLDLNSPL